MNNSGGSSSVISRHDYLPFGEEITSGVGLRTMTQTYGAGDTNRQKYGFTERDSTTGLDHTGWRKYENLAGRWTSPDPYNGSATTANPQSFNRYNYVQNDPVNLVDPSGLNLESPDGSGGFCIRFHYSNPATGEGFWGGWMCFGGGGGSGGGGGGAGGGANGKKRVCDIFVGGER